MWDEDDNTPEEQGTCPECGEPVDIMYDDICPECGYGLVSEEPIREADDDYWVDY